MADVYGAAGGREMVRRSGLGRPERSDGLPQRTIDRTRKLPDRRPLKRKNRAREANQQATSRRAEDVACWRTLWSEAREATRCPAWHVFLPKGPKGDLFSSLHVVDQFILLAKATGRKNLRAGSNWSWFELYLMQDAGEARFKSTSVRRTF